MYIYLQQIYTPHMNLPYFFSHSFPWDFSYYMLPTSFNAVPSSHGALFRTFPLFHPCFSINNFFWWSSCSLLFSSIYSICNEFHPTKFYFVFFSFRISVYLKNSFTVFRHSLIFFPYFTHLFFQNLLYITTGILKLSVNPNIYFVFFLLPTIFLLTSDCISPKFL